MPCESYNYYINYYSLDELYNRDIGKDSSFQFLSKCGKFRQIHGRKLSHLSKKHTSVLCLHITPRFCQP